MRRRNNDGATNHSAMNFLVGEGAKIAPFCIYCSVSGVNVLAFFLLCEIVGDRERIYALSASGENRREDQCGIRIPASNGRIFAKCCPFCVWPIKPAQEPAQKNGHTRLPYGSNRAPAVSRYRLADELQNRDKGRQIAAPNRPQCRPE